MNIVVIPARLASTRLPRKLLLDVHGQPLIWHTIQRALESKLADKIIVATEDNEIANSVEEFSIKLGVGYKVAAITTPRVQSGTDRINWLVYQQIIGGQIVNLQGDEPLLPGSAIDVIFECLGQHEVVTLSADIAIAEYHDENVVKVVTDRTGKALYFSRAAIPHGNPGAAKKHIGIYGYQRIFFERLQRYTEPGWLSRAERLEQLLWMEHGTAIQVMHQPGLRSLGIDSYDDYQELLSRLSSQTATDSGIIGL